MEIKLDTRKTVVENAQDYYRRAKKAKAKIPGIEESIAKTKHEITRISEKIRVEEEKQKLPEKKPVKTHWYEKFRWFTSSDGFLLVGGRDATSNEILIKKHVEKNDVVFHAEITGAPFFVVKNPEGKLIPEETLLETAQASTSYSSGWKKGVGSLDVYHVSPDQVSKTPESGEYLAKGAFVIRGRREWFRNIALKLAVGFDEGDGRIVGGPVSAVEAKCKNFIVIVPGGKKQAEAALEVKKLLQWKVGRDRELSLPEIQYFIPGGRTKVIK